MSSAHSFKKTEVSPASIDDTLFGNIQNLVTVVAEKLDS
jgi:hypothetical protein